MSTENVEPSSLHCAATQVSSSGHTSPARDSCPLGTPIQMACGPKFTPTVVALVDDMREIRFAGFLQSPLFSGWSTGQSVSPVSVHHADFSAYRHCGGPAASQKSFFAGAPAPRVAQFACAQYVSQLAALLLCTGLLLLCCHAPCSSCCAHACWAVQAGSAAQAGRRHRTRRSQPMLWPWRRNPAESQFGTYQPESCARPSVTGESTRRSIAALAPIMISLWKVVLSQCDPLVAWPPSSSRGAPSAAGQLKWSRTACRTVGVLTIVPTCPLHAHAHPHMHTARACMHRMHMLLLCRRCARCTRQGAGSCMDSV
jgi:hypothetical protein